MVFSSAIFLFIFLPIVLGANCLIKKEYSNYLLLIASLFFYAWGEPVLVLVMIFSVVLNWAIGILVGKYEGVLKKLFLAAGIVCSLLVLGYFKYANFLISIINSALGEDRIGSLNLVLPIGISFYTFQAISYIIDVYRGDVKETKKFVNIALYISFFPQLIAGPIVKYKDINEQIESREISYEKIAAGFKRFVYGLGKKVLLANIMGECVDTIYALDISVVGWNMAWVGAVCYMFQIYYDFSGYSDMAIGLGKMFGFDINENFNYPYLSKSITEFWRRWHISLGTWFREYVYIPLGGNRRGIFRTYINLWIVFFLTGLWHGASYTFIVWGLYHGLFMCIERGFLKKYLDKSRVISWVYSMVIVLFGWVIFRAPTLTYAVRYIIRMLMPWKYSSAIGSWYYMNNKTVFTALCCTVGMGLLKVLVPDALSNKWRGSLAEKAYCLIILLLCTAAVISNTYNPFIYFQF